MIELRNLTRQYGTTKAVDNVTATIARGEIVGLLGHNGAGKTTVMKMLTGYLDPSEGQVLVHGLDVSAERTRAQQLIGYLPENAPLYDEMLVQEYLRMMASLRGVPPDQCDARVAEVIRATGLSERLLSPVGTLSKGLRQRVGIAQAIIHKPDVLVLDEPTNGLDPSQIREIRKLVLRLGETTTILLSTHILQEVEAVCQRVLILIGGRLAADAPLAELTGGHHLRLQLSAPAPDVAEQLKQIAGVQSVSASGEDTWLLTWEGSAAPVRAVLEVARNRGWEIAAIGPERRTLESVFQELQDAHATEGGEA